MNLKNENKIIQRNYGIDALRMLSMFMVVVLHILLLSGLLTNEQLFSTQYEIAWLLEICAYCAVNCYALISGYVGVDSKFRFSNIIVLWLRVVFYTFIITMVFFVFIPNSVTKLSFIKALFPVMSSQYWYFTAYFAMFFFIPLLNAALNQIDRIRLKIILISLIILFSVLQTLFCRDVFSTGLGYTAWWLMILYLIGGYIKKYGFLEKCKSGLLFLGYCMMVWITWGSKFIIEKGTLKKFGETRYGDYLVKYTSPTILLAGIFLLLIFKRVSFSNISIKIIKFLSPLAFSVYLIHVNPLIWNYCMAKWFVGYVNKPWYFEVLLVIVTAFAIYFACSIIDIVREYIFKLLKIKKRIEKIEMRILKDI